MVTHDLSPLTSRFIVSYFYQHAGGVPAVQQRVWRERCATRPAWTFTPCVVLFCVAGVCVCVCLLER